MSTSTSIISGIASGLDWTSMIDDLMAVEHASIDLKEEQQAEYESNLEIYQTLNSYLLTLQSQADDLSSIDAFNLFTSSLSCNSSDYSATDFLSVSISSDADPGSHTITMNANSSVAQSRKLSSKSFSDYDEALNISGELVINGQALKIESSYDLGDIRDKINNLNSGTDATGVTATILTVSSDNYRLILTSDNTGEDSFSIFDASADSSNILSDGLGFTDGATSVKNLISNGARSEEFSSSATSVSAMLGLETAQSGSVTFGAATNPDRFSVTIDLSDSLTSIANDINTAASDAGSDISASVTSSTEDGVTTYRLTIENTTSFTDANNVLQTIGILEGNQTDVAEVLISDTANSLTTAGGGPGNIEADTEWEKIDTGGDSNNITNLDTITFTGTNSIGTSISGTYEITDKSTDTVQGLLTAIEDAFAAVDDGSYTVTATIEDGKIKVVDDTTGDSQITLNITANNEGGGTLDLGTVSASMEGYNMEVQAGQDANVIIDGTAVTSSENLIDDVIPGVTLNLLTVESGTTVNVSIARDYDAIESSVQGLLDAYNDIITYINEQFAYDEVNETAGPLQGDGTLSSIKTDLTNIVVNAISGISSTMNALSLIGINSSIDYTDHSTDGMLSIDSDDFTDAMQDYFNDFTRVFIAEGTTTDGDVEYISHTDETVAGEYDINITQAATQAQVSGSSDLSSGIGSSDIEVISIIQSDRVAAITLNGASGENGSSIDDIVNALNSEFDTEYSQTIMGDVKNTTDAAQTTAIASSTTWDSVYSDGVSAGITDNDVITFTGDKKNGTDISGTYTISDASEDTVQGLLSAIESAYDNEVTAAINSYGYLVVTDKNTGNSELSITITGPDGTNLDFGEITTSNLVGSVRNTTDGTNAILSTTTWDGIDGSTVTTGDVFNFSGHTVDGNAVEGSFTVNLGDTDYDDVGDLLGAIESAFDAAGGDVTASIQDGRIIIIDGVTNSTLGIEILEPDGKGVDFGTFEGGVNGRHSLDITASKDESNQLVLTHDEYGSSKTFTVQVSGSDLGLTDDQTYSGLDVEGTINGESATGSGRILTGDAPEDEETSSVEGLTIKYTGTDTGDQGTIKITMGIAELFNRTLFDITDSFEGYLAYKIDSLGDRITDMDLEIEKAEVLLDQKMDTLINQFVAMEVAISKIQNTSSWLESQIASL